MKLDLGTWRVLGTTLIGIHSVVVHHGIEAGSCSEWNHTSANSGTFKSSQKLTGRKERLQTLSLSPGTQLTSSQHYVPATAQDDLPVPYNLGTELS